MPVSFTTLQIFDQYLTTYRGNTSNNNNNKKAKNTSRYDTHDNEELTSVYSNIQWKSRLSPLYLKDPSPQSLAFAVHLKEGANSLTQTISSLSGDDESDLFAQKMVYCDNDELATVEYSSEKATTDTLTNFKLEIDTFATPQVNISKFLPADKLVDIEPDTYSFDILTNKLDYELQFNVNENETNKSLQSKLARLINNSDIGITAKVVNKNGKSALKLTSDAIGLPVHSDCHFSITEENTSYKAGVVDYLNLDKHIKNSTNASYIINGVQNSSYSNTFDVDGAYTITLHPENALKNKDMSKTANIGLYPESESLSYNIEAFVDGYNSFLNSLIPAKINSNEDSLISADTANRLLTNDMNKFLNFHKNYLAQYGISINENAYLEYSKPENMTEPAALKIFGHQVLKKLNTISIDPMEYVERKICAYKNPSTNYINPYTTSTYTGMLFNAHV